MIGSGRSSFRAEGLRTFRHFRQGLTGETLVDETGKKIGKRPDILAGASCPVNLFMSWLRRAAARRGCVTFPRFPNHIQVEVRSWERDACIVVSINARSRA
jgi:hypothetical protein